MRCMVCGHKVEFVRDLSNMRNGLRFYTCWNCQISYKIEFKEHLAVGMIMKAR